MKEFIDKVTGVSNGTPLNRANMMAAQGFAAGTYTMTSNGLEIEYDTGEVLTISFQNGIITEVLDGDKIITKTTTFSGNGAECEVVIQ